MKLLFDQNISHRLIRALQQEYPDFRHVRDVGLRDAAQWEINQPPSLKRERASLEGHL